MSCEIFNEDCLSKMKELPNDSIDLFFCDLPYGQTSCKWDCKIDLQEFWKEAMRIKKLHTPLFFTTTTKFGVELITSAPKKCHFRYDIVWVKSSTAGFLSAKKMPLRKHEMVYVFYEKLPMYDLSSHTHKFIDKDHSVEAKDGAYGKLQIKQPKTSGARWEPALPNSVVKEVIKGGNNTYNTEGRKKPIVREKSGKYETPLPVSVVKEDPYNMYDYDPSKMIDERPSNVRTPAYDPPLPVSVVKEDIRKDKHKTAYGENIHHHCNKQRNGESIYDPPLPNSMLEIKSSRRGKHSTEKPVALMEWILKYYSKEGDTILDPTMGSGSTGIACKNMGRNFIGIEMDDEIFKFAKERIGV